MTDIRPPSEEDRRQLGELLLLSLNFPRARLEARLPLMPLHQFLCAYEGDRIAAAAAFRPFLQWFGGRELPMSGVWAVATVPERRGSGLASTVVAEGLHRARDEGAPISCLYPATLRPYRRTGFELAGTYTDHRIGLDDLPGGGDLPVEEYRPEDVGEIRACYRRAMATHNGPIDCEDEDWWKLRILSPGSPDQTARTVVARGSEGIEGYASFRYTNAEGPIDVAFAVECQHLVASTDAALRSLFSYFRGFRGLGTTLEWPGPPVDSAAFLVDEQRLKPSYTFRWMARLIDVPGALESRGYPPVDGEATIAVEDPMFPGNRGPFLIRAERGKVQVSESDSSAANAVPIGVLSSLFTGYVSAHDAVRTGVLRTDRPTTAFLGELFAGPAPWMLDFF